MLTPAERHQLLHAWNATQVAHPPRQLVTTLVEAQADAGGARLAVADGHTALSYQALDQRANQLAHVLQQRGVGPDVPVVLALPRTTTQVVAALAVLKAGGAYLPLDPSWPAERLAQIVREARPALVLTDTTLAHVCATQAAPVLVLDAVWDELVAPAPCHRPAAPVLPEHLAYVIYTSGSTGQPKGIAVTHASLHNLIHWYQRTYQLRGHDRVAHVVGQAFDVAVSDLWTTLASGASLHLPDEGQRRDPQQLVAWLAAQAITVAFVATPLAELVLQRASPDGLVLRVLLTGGDKLRRGPQGALPYLLADNYGPAENTVISTWTEVATGEAGIGRPIDNVQVYVLDAGGQPTPIGVPGELYLGGANLARGYLHRAELTAERFVPHPFGAAGERLYRTGDVVRYRADGGLEFLRRQDQQVKIRGFRVELGEIEAVANQAAGVQACVVLAREEGGQQRQLVGYVVGRGAGVHGGGAAAPPAAPAAGLHGAGGLRGARRAATPAQWQDRPPRPPRA
ncbi:MAG: amino acid adenylation domain-containing protein [Kouleothrix sp.]|nr:amino acid adenylation domain-containing protein [Kouleothrix sp.]